MGKFASSAFRQGKKRPKPLPGQKPEPRIYRSWGQRSKFIEHERGRARLSWEGREAYEKIMRVLNEKKRIAQKARESKKRHELLKKLFKKPRPISFKTSDGKKINIVKNGFENIFVETPKVPPRALVLVLVNGKKLFFYRSSGQSSNMPGEWFPTFGPNKNFYGEEKVELGWLHKLAGHPDPNQKHPKTYFPLWIDEIRKKIKQETAGKNGRIILNKEWGVKEYLEIDAALKKVPLTDLIKSKYD